MANSLSNIIQQDLEAEDGDAATPTWNDNQGCVDWTKCRHVCMRNFAVRLHQRLGHIDGTKNIADLFTKEMKDKAHHIDFVCMIVSPRQAHLAAVQSATASV